jgi:YVTN family beta-propeller protein
MKKSIHVTLLASAAAFAAPGGYHITSQIKVGGTGGWDYLTVDTAARRLYVSHGTKVEVIDLDAAKSVGEIPDTPGVHGIAVVPELNKGFVSNGKGNNVTIFDLKTLKPLGQISTGKNPDAIQYEPVSGKVYTFNGGSNDATAIDAKTGKVEGTIKLGGRPEFSAADGKGKIYVNIEDTAEIVEIDAAKMKETKRYSIKPCESPSGLAMDTAKRRVFSVCENEIMAISNPDSGKVIATPKTGKGADGASFDPGTGLAFSSNGDDGTLSVIQEKSGSWTVVENVTTKKGARTMTVDAKTHNLYLPAAEYGAKAPGAKRASVAPGSFQILVMNK